MDWYEYLRKGGKGIDFYDVILGRCAFWGVFTYVEGKDTKGFFLELVRRMGT